jgi:hypothetical protein
MDGHRSTDLRVDFIRCHPASDITHLLADIVASCTGRERDELRAQISRGLSLEPSAPGLLSSSP